MCLVGPERTWKGEVSKTHTPVVVQVILAEIPEAVFFVVSWLLEFQTQMLHVTGIFTYYEFTIKQSTIHVKVNVYTYGSYMKRSRFTHGIFCSLYSDLENSQVAVRSFPSTFDPPKNSVFQLPQKYGYFWEL